MAKGHRRDHAHATSAGLRSRWSTVVLRLPRVHEEEPMISRVVILLVVVVTAAASAVAADAPTVPPPPDPRLRLRRSPRIRV